MRTPHRILLFDLDGVLVAPHGYRRAIHATLEHFTRRMGLGDCHPGEEAIARFESISMTSEWDIVAIYLAALLDALIDAHPELHLPPTLEDTCTYLSEQFLRNPPTVDTMSLAHRLGEDYQGGAYSDLALALCRDGSTPSQLADTRMASHPPLFPRLAGHLLLKDLLGHTRQVTVSTTTRLFQAFALGSRAFMQTYAQPAPLETPSYLQEFDLPLILPETRRILLRAWQEGAVDTAVYTARPSLPVGDTLNLKLLYSPEAELALDVVGLSSLPLVGYGEVCQLAELTGHSPEEMVKPSPVQALASIGAALGRCANLPALLGAERLFFTGDASFFQNLPPLEVHIFEDAAGGVRAVHQACALLEKAGLSITIHAWGISTNADKVATLRQAGAKISADINQALQAINLTA